MKPIAPIKQQSLEYHLGSYLAERFCAPLAFYLLLKAAGYLPAKLMAGPFCRDLDHEKLTANSLNWSRPALSKLFRKEYGASIVSWWINGKELDLERMKKSGYVESKKEIKFLEENIVGKSLKEVVNLGYPVIVTMKPGFGGSGGVSIHAVIIVSWEGDRVTVVDPDARNVHSEFSAKEILESITPEAAGTIVLPKKRRLA